MIILFDPSFPPSLLEALNLILNIEEQNPIRVVSYNGDIQEDTSENPVIFLIDGGKKGVSHQTKMNVKSGCRVFAFKYPKDNKNLSLFSVSLTVLSLLPKALELIQNNQSPFLYTFTSNSKKFSKVNIKS